MAVRVEISHDTIGAFIQSGWKPTHSIDTEYRQEPATDNPRGFVLVPVLIFEDEGDATSFLSQFAGVIV